MKLRHKIALFVIVIQTVLIAVIIAQSVISEINKTYESMSSYAKMMAKAVAGRWISDIITGNMAKRSDLNQFTNIMISFDSRIAYIVVSDKDKNVLAGGINRKWVEHDVSKDVALAQILKSESKYKSFKSVSVDIESEGSYIGNIKIVFSLSPLKRQILISVLTWIGIGLGVTIFCIAGAFIISKRITNPLNKVVEAMSLVESGDLEQKVNIKTSDEVGVMAGAFNKMVDGLKEREFIKDTFSKYVSRQVADKILKEKDFLKLKGEKRMLTVLFADIRGFTPLAESLPPEKVLEILNQYFSKMVDIVFKYGGMLNKFIGDAIMVLYNAPLDQRYHELRAILTGIEIQKEIAKINEQRRRQGEIQINMGIGINTGEAVAGNVGSALRLEYTVIGSGVNLAQRIESHTESGQLLISESTYSAVRDFVEVIKLNPVHVKGISEPVQLYTVIKANVPEDFNETI